jgi:hypothetical protein
MVGLCSLQQPKIGLARARERRSVHEIPLRKAAALAARASEHTLANLVRRFS